MVVKLNLKGDVEVEAAMKDFYMTLGLSEEEAARKVKRFEEYVHRVKGIEPARETLIDYIIDEIWWVGVWYAMEHTDQVIYDKEAPADPDGDDEEELAEHITKKVKDEDLGGMFG